jgi:thiamine biosynthesis lipoprotein
MLIVMVLISTPTQAAEPRRFEFSEPHMGTVFKVVLYSPDEAAASRASRLAFDRIEELNKALSDYDPESELMKLCARAGGPATPVSPDLYTMLDRSKQLAERSQGAFDPTIAPVVRLWRRARRDRKKPDPDLIARALELVDHHAIELDPKARTARLTRPGVKLDLGAIAKGYASDEAIHVLRRAGVTSALVAGSGDIVVSDPPPGKAGWTIAVAPLEETSEAAPGRSIVLKNAAVSTSGDAEQFVIIDGVRYSHVLDPKTGLGLTERRSVTVIAPDGATADGLDTAACVLGPEKGLALIEATPGCAGLFTRLTPDGPETTPTRGWKAYESGAR